MAWDADVLLANGSIARIRPIVPADAQALQVFHRAQSDQSTYFRFFAPVPELSPQELSHLTTVDNVDRVALVVVEREQAESAGPGAAANPGPRTDSIIAVGRFDRYGEDQAEVAFNVADSHQGMGLGSILLEHLAAIAREISITRFTAEVLPTNAKMLRVFDDAGYRTEKRHDDGVVAVSIDLDPTQRSTAVSADREWRSDVASMRPVFEARRIALVIGSDGPQMPPQAFDTLLANLQRSTAPIAVSVMAPPGDTRWRDPKHREILAQDATNGTAGIDLALICSASGTWAGVIEDLDGSGAVGAIIYAQAPIGGADRDDPGAALRRARRAGIRIIGPGSAGIRITRDDGTLDATCIDCGDVASDPGAGVFCQSAVAAALTARRLRENAVAVSSFISAGDRIDVSGNEALQWWAQDNYFVAGGVYLESLGNARKFARAARRLSARSPLAILTAAATGGATVPGHRTRTSASARRTLATLFRHAGLIRVADIDELGDTVALLAAGAVPHTDRIAVSSEVSGGAELVEMELSARGFAVRREPAVSPTTGQDKDEIRVHVLQRARDVGPASLLVALEGSGGRTRTPSVSSPSAAAQALRGARDYALWRARDHGELVRATVDRARARRLLRRWEPGEQPRAHLANLLDCYGVELARLELVTDLPGALAAADAIGYPVALTTGAPGLRHRSDLGVVRLGIGSAAELSGAFLNLVTELDRLNVQTSPLRLQAMAPVGAACVVRSREDELFGPVVSVGIAGDATDLLDDWAEVLPPATEADIRGALDHLVAAPRLRGVFPTPPVDREALADIIGRVALLADDNPEIASLELRPVVVGGDGARVLDGRVVVGRARRNDNERRCLVRW
ncbi:acyl-CoA synthetase (NDP forming) [Rarobacter incanus]|uniref:Acyl-CoA synthetase (NDP forming) n=2 Tax=Rarobacter incanus TaxID=153494 RepID=A0A542SMP1_9MICO|nr:acyl-CoA synthetase (NDP forming) [Rarobacter incanus]